MSMDPFSVALSQVGFVADWAGRVSPVVFVFKGTLAYLSYNGECRINKKETSSIFPNWVENLISNKQK